MLVKSLAAVATAAVALSATPAFAGDKENLAACWAAISTERQLDTSELRFRSISGASVQKIRFDVTENGERSKAVCKVKRGKIVEISYEAA